MHCSRSIATVGQASFGRMKPQFERAPSGQNRPSPSSFVAPSPRRSPSPCLPRCPPAHWRSTLPPSFEVFFSPRGDPALPRVSTLLRSTRSRSRGNRGRDLRCALASSSCCTSDRSNFTASAFLLTESSRRSRSCLVVASCELPPRLLLPQRTKSLRCVAFRCSATTLSHCYRGSCNSFLLSSRPIWGSCISFHVSPHGCLFVFVLVLQAVIFSFIFQLCGASSLALTQRCLSRMPSPKNNFPWFLEER